MMSTIQVFSEIGKLKKVLLHRPGREIENLTPDYLERLLFDDIPYLKVAIQEHDRFAALLRENGAEVLYLEEMLEEVLQETEVKKEFIDEILPESDVFSNSLKQAITEYLLAMPTKEMIETMMAGIRTQEIKYKKSSLSDVIKNDYEFYLDPMPNLYFTRDPGACIGNGMTLNTMKTLTRRRETLFLKYLHERHPLFQASEVPLWYDRTLPNYIEGGDELVLSDKVLAIGCSERTSSAAIEKVAKNLFRADTSFEKVLVFEIQKRRAYMHLDTVFTMIDYDKFTVHPGIEKDLNLYEVNKGAKGEIEYKALDDPLVKVLQDSMHVDQVDLIRCGASDAIAAAREQWNDGSNTLAIAPGVVITYERNYVSNELLEKKGVKVITMPSSELSRGRGGPRCMSMPLNRDKI